VLLAAVRRASKLKDTRCTMYSGLLIILLPLIVGYLIPLRHRPLLVLINRLLSWMVYVILFFMGISLAFMEDLSSNLVVFKSIG
jgi:uncharacterized membrane protein YbjE (DUF340 family)